MPASAAEACARYLRRLGGLSKLVEMPYGLHSRLDLGLGEFSVAARAFLASSAQQLEAIDLHHRLHFGIVERALDTGESSSGRQDAYAVADPFAKPEEAGAALEKELTGKTGDTRGAIWGGSALTRIFTGQQISRN